MPNIEPGTFGLAIAFMAPGVVGLWGIGQHVPTIREWFGATPQSQATAGGFLFVLLAAIAVGVFLSGLRQLLLDQLLFERLLDLKRPSADESKLAQPEVRDAIRFSADSYYRYYQFYANMAVAVAVAYVAWVFDNPGWSGWRFGGLLLLFSTIFVLIMSAKYSLERYYTSLRGIFLMKEGEPDE